MRCDTTAPSASNGGSGHKPTVDRLPPIYRIVGIVWAQVYAGPAPRRSATESTSSRRIARCVRSLVRIYLVHETSLGELLLDGLHGMLAKAVVELVSWVCATEVRELRFGVCLHLYVSRERFSGRAAANA